jgi:hypothetical protein
MIDRQGYQTITEYLDNEYPTSSGNLLIMSGLETDYLNQQTAEFGEPESHEAREVKELTAYRVADTLDHLENYCGQEVLAKMGKEVIRTTAGLILARVVLEFRAIARHREQAADHDCQKEFCPLDESNLDSVSDDDWDSYNDLMTRNSGSMPLPTQINEQAISTNDLWAGEWE